MTMSSEIAYLFRHAVMREAAYQLHVPSERGRLHRIALEILQSLARGPSRRAWAREMADHAREVARSASGATAERFLKRELAHLTVAARDAAASFRNLESADLWRRVSLHERTDVDGSVAAAIAEADVCARLGDVPRALRAVDAGSRRLSRGKPGTRLDRIRRRARLELARGGALASTADQRRCISSLRRAARGFAEVGDAGGRVRALVGLVRQLDTTGQARAAIRMASLAERVAASANDRAGLASALCAGALVHSARLSSEERLERLGNARRLLRRAGALERIQVLNGMAMRHLDRGDPRRAAALALAALSEARMAGAKQAEAMVRSNIGIIRTEAGRVEEGLAEYEQALAAARESGARLDEARILGNIANLHVSAARYDRAEESFRDALRTLRAVNSPREEANVLGNFALLLDQTGRFGSALQAYDRCREALAKCGERVLAGVYAALHAELRLLVGDVAGARRDVQSACAAVDATDFAAWRVQFALPAAFRVAMAEALEPGGSVSACRRTMAELAGLAKRHRFGPDHVAGTKRAVCERTLAEYECARTECRAPSIFRGHLIEGLEVHQRRAILARLAAEEPEALERLRTDAPAVLERMRAGTDAVSEPDWRRADLS